MSRFTTRVLLGALLGCLAAVGLPFAAAPGLAANPVTYMANDTSPDTPGAPDITSVLVTDTTQGLITFQINFTPGTEQQPQDSYSVFVDSDQNPTTGDPGGAGTDYLLLYDGTPGGGLGVFKWDGNSSYRVVDGTSLRGTFSGDSQYFTIAASELGITDGFNFNVAAAIGSDPVSSSQVDLVPESGTNFHYSVQSKAVITLTVSDSEDGAVVRAGQPYDTEVQVTRSDTGAVATSGKVQCLLAFHGHRVPVILNGFQKVPWYKGAPRVAAVCMYQLPKGAAGMTLTARETVTVGGATASKLFVFRVHK
ncbi:MAG: hypothetical protein QOK22_727 [Gaiellaceae bacterium]|nr:hypothetical protein [Gaiellaceae bacterium]